MPAIVRFVDSVGGIVSRLDLSPGNAGGMQLGEGVDFGRPKLAALTADAASGDGDPYVASSYGNRRVRLPVALPRVASMAARQAALGALARELDRRSNVLYVRPDTGDTGIAPTFDATLEGWAPNNANSTVVQTTAQARTGAGSMSITAIAASGSSAKLDQAGLCNPGTPFRVGWGAKAATTGRTTQMVVNWFSSSTWTGFLSNNTAQVVDVTTGWTYQQSTLTAPAGAHSWTVSIQVLSPGAGETHYIDDPQIDPYDGRWLVTYRAADAAAWLLLRADALLAEETIAIDAAPFAYGAAQPVTLGTASGDPEQGTWTFSVPAAAGDVDSPLTLTAFVGSGPTGTPAAKFYCAARARVWPDATLKYQLAAPDAAITNVASTVVTGAAGAAGTAYRWTPPSGAEAYVFGGFVPDFVSAPTPAACRELIGRWRILARIRRSAGGDVFSLRARVRGATTGAGTGALLAPDPYVFGGTGGWTYADLGTMQVPVAEMAAQDMWGDPPAVMPQAVEVYATRVSGSGTFDCDHLLALPADGRTLIADMGGNVINTVADAVVADGDRNTVYVVRDYTAARYIRNGVLPIGFDGGMLRLSPRYAMQVFIVPDAADPGVITSTLNLVGSYRPRYLDAL